MSCAAGRPIALSVGLPSATEPMVQVSAASLERLLTAAEPAAALLARGAVSIEAARGAWSATAVGAVCEGAPVWAWTSALVTRPFVPLGVTVRRSTDKSRASLRVAGVANGFSLK